MFMIIWVMVTQLVQNQHYSSTLQLKIVGIIRITIRIFFGVSSGLIIGITRVIKDVVLVFTVIITIIGNA